jgi:transposase InsO family protein
MSTNKNAKRTTPQRIVYSVEFKLRAVKLFLEEGYTTELIAGELGIGKSTVTRWVKRYREYGIAGLQPRPTVPKTPQQKVSPAVKRKAVELKKQDPSRGSRRISHLLRRFHLMKASPETVRRTLKEEGLVEPPKTRPKRNPQKPRFFERSTPNQLWQTDIFCFRLGGRAAYLIGYIDDYSRYITGLGLYRSQTAEHVIETFRRAVAEYGVPKEMLTDNGRQYTNWRGTTRFERELRKDRIKHIKSQPHHPMTLGKIERFWKSIFGEFLSRVQFDSFEDAQQRLALWVKYYNYKRPHQGIGGLCPADRFFEIQTQLRKVLEEGIEENVLEAALRGPPHQPFYMVGRMGDQSVVIRAEKGKVKMLVDGEESGKEKELVYHVNEHNTEEGNEEAAAGVCGAGEVRSGAGGMERAPEAGGGLPGDGDPLAAADQLAGHGDEGDDARARSETQPRRTAASAAEPENGEAAGEGGCGGDAPEPGGSAAGLDPADGGGEEERVRSTLAEKVALLPAEDAAIVLELLEGCITPPEPGRMEHECVESGCPPENRSDPQGTGRTDQCDGSGKAAGDQPQDLLQVGAPRPGGDDGGPLRAEPGPSLRRIRWSEETDGAPDQGAGT